MSQTNPYAMAGAMPAAVADADARARFLTKTYTWVLYGILAFCATLWGYENNPTINGLGNALFGNWIIGMVVLVGASIAVHAFAERSPINVVVYFAFAFVMGLVLGPIVSFANETAPGIVTQASLATALTFLVLTAVVFVTGKDFGFLKGILWTGLIGLFLIALCSMIFGFGIGIWYSYAGALIFSGFILYDTSNILRRYPTTAHIAAAVVLFVDIIMLFKHLLLIFLSNNND